MLLAFIDGIGFGEWIVLLAVILLVVGPKRLPLTARAFARHYARFRRAAESFKRQILDMDTQMDNAIQDAVKDIMDDPSAPQSTAAQSADAQGSAVDPPVSPPLDSESPDGH